jgi:hypothetical protein
MDKSLLKQAPTTLCQLLSPFTHPRDAVTQLVALVANQPLLEKTIECANRHFVAATLYAQLQQHRLLSHLPPDLHDYLRTVHELQQARNQRLEQQMRFILHTFNQAQITPLLLKGGDTLFYYLYPTSGARFMSDLDILMPAGTVSRGQQLLANQGYAIPDKYKNILTGIDPHHAIPIYKEGDDCAIELHYKPLSHRPGNLLISDEVFQNSQPVISLLQGNLHARSLSPNHKVLHCFIHSEISHGYGQTDMLDIRQMDYFVRLVKYYQDEIDWTTLQAIVEHAGLTQDWAVYHYKAQQLFGLPNTNTVSSAHILANVFQQRYQAALVSAMSQYYPWRSVKLGLLHLSGVFSRERLGGIFVINSPQDHLWAVIKRLQQLTAQYALSPASLAKRIQTILTSGR